MKHPLHRKSTLNSRLHKRYFDDTSNHLDRFGVVLVLTAINLLVLLLVDVGATTPNSEHSYAPLLVYLVSGMTFIFSLRAAGFNNKVERVCIALFSIGIITHTLSLIIFNTYFDTSTDAPIYGFSLFWVLIAIITPIATTLRLTQHKVITIKTLFAAVSSYLQIAIAFTYIFIYISILNAGTFFASIQPTTSYAYYSLTTITTVGYGDLYAITNVGRAMSVSEALIGQIYLVTLVAMIVGSYAANRK